MGFISQLRNQASADLKRVVFSEGDDERILQACIRLAKDGVVRPILVGELRRVNERLFALGYDREDASIEVIQPEGYKGIDDMVRQLVDEFKSRGKNMTPEAAISPLNFAYMLLRNNAVDGAVNGAVHTTADVVRSAISIIGTKENQKLVSSFFLMISEKCREETSEDVLIFADCALVIDPDSEQLESIAEVTIKSAEALFSDEVRVAMLSFSSDGSAKHPEALKVAHATQNLRRRYPNLLIDGEIQFDAAFVPEISKKKITNSLVNGRANVFVFPNLSAANIGYKIAQRMANVRAIGPVLQGLAKPANDLSRGCSVEDVYNLAMITAIQAQQNLRNQTVF